MKGEDTDHVKSYVRALKQVGEANPGLFADPSRIWNMDETEVSGEFGEHERVFGPSSTCHAGFKASEGRGTGKHLTAVIIASAAGHVLPPFFYIRGLQQDGGVV